MQKKLIALAVAGLFAVPALAQTNVTISGKFVGGYDNYSVKDCQVASDCRSESRFSDQSSRVIFNIVEDLGGGLKAWGQLDARFLVDTGGSNAAGTNQWASGNTGMGLMHASWGKVTLGRWDMHYDEIWKYIGGNRAGSQQTNLGDGLMSQVATTAGGAATAQTVGFASRTANLLMWDSPNWNGFTGRLGYSTNPAANEGSGVTTAANSGNAGGGYAWSAALRYNNGPWAAGYSHYSSKSENRQEVIATGANVAAINDLTGDRIWLGYKFAMGLKLGFAYDWSSNDNGAATFVGTTKQKRGAWYLPVSYSWGPHAIYAQYARAGDTSNDMGMDTGASAWNIGYDYAFSKRTSMGIYYTALSNKSGGNYNLKSVGGSGATAIGSGAAGTTGLGADARQWYIGMAHSF
jgi:predicted porin